MANGTGYRRGSVFGALLLIGLGVLFLYANLNQQFNPWPLLAKYWPVLIIFWGLGKLVDYFMLRGTDQAATVSRLTAGDIIGIFFLILLGTSLSTLVTKIPSPHFPFDNTEFGCLFGREFEFSQEVKQALPAPGGRVQPFTLVVDGNRSNLAVTGVAGSEIHLAAKKKICAQDNDEAFRSSEAYQPVLEPTAAGYAFRWRTQAGESDALQADLDFQVPAAAGVKLTTRHGDVRVSSVQGAVEINLSGGDATVAKVGGDVRVGIRGGATTVTDTGGSVVVEGRGDGVDIRNAAAASLEGEFFGPIRFAAIRGPVRFRSKRTDFSAGRLEGEMELASDRLRLKQVPGDVSLDTRDKEIEMEEITGEVRIQNRNGGIELRARRAPTLPIQIENASGNIEVTLPAGSGFQLDATARNGRVESDFQGEGLKLEDRGGDQTLSGAYGNGRVPIRLSTHHGNIYLRRAGG